VKSLQVFFISSFVCSILFVVLLHSDARALEYPPQNPLTLQNSVELVCGVIPSAKTFGALDQTSTMQQLSNRHCGHICCLYYCLQCQMGDQNACEICNDCI